MFNYKNDSIYLNRDCKNYCLLLKRAVIMFCSRASDDVMLEYNITPFTCSEILKFLRLLESMSTNIDFVIDAENSKECN